MNEAQQERRRSVRRDLHSYPEPAWREFYTTSRIVEEIERIGVDQLYIGRDVVDGDARMAVPDDDELEDWQRKARDAGAREDVLEAAAGGFTGALAVLKQGEGPTVALRVDIDALPITESDSVAHAPATEEFRSTNEGYMHACGHDAHATIGLGVLEAVKESDFKGTFKVVFQPAEEVIGGGKAVAESGHLDDVDHLLAIHIGLDHPTGEIVAGVGGGGGVRQRTLAGIQHRDGTLCRPWRPPYRTSMRFAGTVTAQRVSTPGLSRAAQQRILSPEKRRWKARSAAKRRHSRST